MAGWHHRLNGHDFKQALGIGDGQGSLVCCNPWGRKESDMTEWLNWTDFRSFCLVTMPGHIISSDPWQAVSEPFCTPPALTGQMVLNVSYHLEIVKMDQLYSKTRIFFYKLVCHKTIQYLPHTSQKGQHQKSTDNKYWRECREKQTLLHCWWECKLVQPFWRMVQKLLKKTKNRATMLLLSCFSHVWLYATP